MSSLDFAGLLRAVVVTVALVFLGIGHADAGGTRLVLHLDTPAAALTCPDCIGLSQRQAIARAGVLLADAATDPVQALERLLSHGAGLGGAGFSGLSVDLRRVATAGDRRHYLAI
jgi:hypothetical protein